jgi:hypothetical protein
MNSRIFLLCLSLIFIRSSKADSGHSWFESLANWFSDLYHAYKFSFTHAKYNPLLCKLIFKTNTTETLSEASSNQNTYMLKIKMHNPPLYIFFENKQRQYIKKIECTIMKTCQKYVIVYFILRHGARYYYPWRGYEANYLRRDTIKREGEKLEEILKNKFNFFSFIKEKPLSERFSLLSGEYPAHNRIHKFIIP